jgi:AcrR family transcriptional regulator
MKTNIIREDIKDLILDAADKLLNKFGYKKMTMDLLAQEIDIGKGTLYLHFRSKEELVLSYIDRVVYRLLVRLQITAHNESLITDRLREMLLIRVLFRFDNMQHYKQSLCDLLSDIRPKLMIQRERHFELEAKIFKEVLNEGVNNGVFTVNDFQTTSYAMLQATNSLLPYNLSADEFGKRKDVEKQVSCIADLLLSGLLNRNDKKSKRA